MLTCSTVTLEGGARYFAHIQITSELDFSARYGTLINVDSCVGLVLTEDHEKGR